jgi:hypothetical protein
MASIEEELDDSIESDEVDENEGAETRADEDH